MTEHKPTAEALNSAAQLIAGYPELSLLHKVANLMDKSATTLAAKDAEIERLKMAVHEKIVAAECFERERDFAWNERDKLREQNQQQRALLVSLATALKPFADIAYNPVGWFAGWATGEAKAHCQNAAKELSTPAVVELLKEAGK